MYFYLVYETLEQGVEFRDHKLKVFDSIVGQSQISACRPVQLLVHRLVSMIDLNQKKVRDIAGEVTFRSDLFPKIVTIDYMLYFSSHKFGSCISIF
jgi:hypothetical protein